MSGRRCARWIGILMLTAIAGCSRKSGDSEPIGEPSAEPSGDPSGDPSGGPSAEAPAAPAKWAAPGSDDLWLGADPESVREAWQGTWTMPFRRDPDGPQEVWTVRDAGVEMLVAGKTETWEMRLVAPCLAKLVQQAENRERYRYLLFRIEGGRVFPGAEGGVETDAGIVACIDAIPPAVVTRRGETCEIWQRPTAGPKDKLAAAPAECSVVEEEGRRVLTVRAGTLRGERRFVLRDGAVAVPDDHANPAEPVLPGGTAVDSGATAPAGEAPANPAEPGSDAGSP